jgi:hypothetical protein
MPLINNDKWGRRVARVGPIAAIMGVGLALTAAALLVLAVIVLR